MLWRRAERIVASGNENMDVQMAKFEEEVIDAQERNYRIGADEEELRSVEKLRDETKKLQAECSALEALLKQRVRFFAFSIQLSKALSNIFLDRV